MRTILIAAALAAGLSAAEAQTQAEIDAAAAASWADLVTNVFDDRPIADGTGVIALEAPYRAEDAAIVPVTIRNALPPQSGLSIRKITLVIDENPSPVAAEFTFGPAGTVREIDTRVRVNSYTNIHAVAEASDGKLYAVAKYVKASGGCSAPALKDPKEAMAHLGEMKLRWFGDAADGAHEAQLMIRHPNNSGLQMDPVSRNYIPAFFIRDLSVESGGKPLLAMQGGISISENPTFRFTFSGDAGPISVKAVDTDEHRFEQSWPVPDAKAS